MNIKGKAFRVDDYLIVEKFDPFRGKVYDIFDIHTFRLLVEDSPKDSIERLLNLKLDDVIPKNINRIKSKRKNKGWLI